MPDTSVEKFIYFIRHGQSEANTEPVFQGPNALLTDFGREQARFVGERLRSVDAQVVLTSPMPRARETADIIVAATGLVLEENALFREYMPPSSLSGQSKDLPEGQRFLREQRENIGDPAWHYEDEDNYHDLHERACEALDHLVARPEPGIIVVSHAGFMRVLLTAMLTERTPDPVLAQRLVRFLKPQNTGITLCRYRSDATRRNTWRLLTWSDHAHLADTPLADPSAQELWEAEPGEL